MEDFKNDTVFCAASSDATIRECKSLIGKTVAKVKAHEHGFMLIFTDGTSVELRGTTYEGKALSVEVLG